MLVETASVADVHAEADDTSPVLATLSGTQAKVLENSGRWMKVQVGDITGWVESEHLTDGSDTLDDIAPVNPEETQNPGDTEEQTEQTQDLQTEETLSLIHISLRAGRMCYAPAVLVRGRKGQVTQ